MSLQRVRVLLEARVHFHHHVILVQRRVHGRDLALAEGVVQRVVDQLAARRPAATPCRGRSPASSRRPSILLVGVGVADLRQRAHASAAGAATTRSGRSDCRRAACIDTASCSTGRRRGCPARPAGTGSRRERATSLPRSRLITWSALTLRSAQRLQLDEHAARVGGAAAGEADHVLHRRILPARCRTNCVSFSRMAGKRDVLRGLHGAHQAAGVLLRKEALGHDDVQVDVQADGAERRPAAWAADAAAPRPGCVS